VPEIEQFIEHARAMRRGDPRSMCLRHNRTTPSSRTPPDTDDGTRHEADRQADVASEHYDEQRDRCDNEPLLCIRHRSHLTN
jgi:hypothetical protein